MAPFRLLIARLRVDQLPALLIIGLVFATALAAAATPRLFNRVADDGLRYEVREATVVERNLQLGRITRIEAAPGQAMAPVDSAEAGVEEDLSGRMIELVGLHRFDDADVVDDAGEMREHF